MPPCALSQPPRAIGKNISTRTACGAAHIYNPATAAAVLQRQTKADWGPAAEPLQSALAKVSRILPLITTAHLPSAANNSYWPEIYQNMSLLDGSAAAAQAVYGYAYAAGCLGR